MHPALRDTAGPGTLFWLIGYLAGIVLFFTPLKNSMGWIIMAVLTPVTIMVTWWWFRGRDLPLRYFAGVGIAWMLIAVVLDYLFIVQLFRSPAYYAPHVFIYYALMVLIPVGVGIYLSRERTAAGKGSHSG